MKPWDKIKMWLFGSEADARLLHERHMPAVSIGLPTDETGDQQDDVDGTLVGGVIWPVKQGTHGGRAFLSSAMFLAEYDKKKREVWMLDRETGTRHTGALPLKVGDTVFPLSDSGGRGVVIRTAEFGNAGIKRNVFIPLSGLMAHHLPPDQPTESSQVHDKDGRAGGLHYLTRVREFVREFCIGATAVVGERLFAPLLNFTRNGDNTPAHGAAHFRVGEACLSAEAGGPLHPADDGQHELGQTSEAKVMSAGLEIEQTKFGSTPLGIIYSPAEFVRDPWVPGAKGPIVKRVEWREDFNDQHVNACGKTARGRKKWLTWADKRTYPVYPPPKDPPRRPPGVPPTIPPEIPPQPPLPPFDDSPPPPIPGPITGDPPPPSTEDPASPIKPVTGERPTNSGPNEEEQPSIRGVAVPDLDKPQSRGENDGTERGWRDTLGFNEAEWLRFPRISHDVAQGVFLQEYAAGTLAADALFSLYAHGTFARDLDGNWYGARGHGQGVQTLMPGGLEGYLAYKARNGGDLPAGYTPTLTRLLLNYQTAAGREVRTYFGLGARTPQSVLPASGWYFKLDYTDGHDVPDLDIRSTDSAGLDVSTGRVVKINGTPISAGSGDVVGPSSAVDNALARFDTTTGKLIQEGDLVLDDVSGNFALLHTKNNGAGNSNGLRLDVGTATGTAGGIQIGNSNATAVDISKSGVTTAVKGPLEGASSIKSTSSSAGIGYATGAGGTVTQATDKATSVTINAVCGQIETHDANLPAGGTAVFAVNNSAVAATDVVVAVIAAGASSTGKYRVQATEVDSGTFNIGLDNISAVDVAEAVTISFVVIKGVTS